MSQVSQVVPVVSPDGSLVVTVEAGGREEGAVDVGKVDKAEADGTAAAGDIYYSLSYKGRILIERSAIGRFVLRNAPPLGGRWKLERVVNSSADETYTLPWGPVKTVHNHYNEAVFHWTERIEGGEGSPDGRSGRLMLLVVRVYNEGAAFRYVFPEQPGPAEWQITGELTSFRFPADYTAFIARASDFRSYELEYPPSQLSSVGADDKVRLPLLIKAVAEAGGKGSGQGEGQGQGEGESSRNGQGSGQGNGSGKGNGEGEGEREGEGRSDGGSNGPGDAPGGGRGQAEGQAWMAITEAELVDYAGMYLTRGADANTLVSILSPYRDDPELRVVARLPFATPWRVIMVADTPGKLIENNTLILNLNPPCKIQDTSWIKPGLSAWHWWSGHRAEGGTFVVPNFEAEGQEQGQGQGQSQGQNLSQRQYQEAGQGQSYGQGQDHSGGQGQAQGQNQAHNQAQDQDNGQGHHQGQGQGHGQGQSQGQDQGQGQGPNPCHSHTANPSPSPIPSHGQPQAPARRARATEVVTYEPFPGRVDNQTIRYYTDFAAAHGFAYNLIDAGWYSSEGDAWAKPLELDITKQLPEIDIPELVQYARRRGVGIWIWVHAASLERQLDEAFALYKKWGVAGVKVDSYGRDDQPFVRFINKMVEKAAEYQLMINFHGAYKPTGIRRTWPNLLTCEAVLGLEYAKVTSKPGRPSPTHNVTIPFTRMLAGPMDYTPGWFGTIDLGLVVKGTRAHQLAMYVVYESPLQMVSDTPMAYEGQVGIDFLERVPTTWDETRVLLGEPGAYVSIARRSGNEWYVGTMTNEEPRVLEIPLNFLGDGEYIAYIYEDGHDDGYEALAGEDPGPASAAAHPDPASTRLRREMVNRDTVLTARLAGGGGQAIRLTPAIQNIEQE